MLEKKKIRYNEVYRAITRSAVTEVDTSTAKDCGGVAGATLPNNVFGYGRIDAMNAVNAVSNGRS